MTLITAKELAKGSEFGGLKGNPGKKIFVQIHLEVQSSKAVISMRHRSKYLPHPLQMDSTQQENTGNGRKLIDIKQLLYISVAHVILGSD